MRNGENGIFQLDFFIYYYTVQKKMGKPLLKIWLAFYFAIWSGGGIEVDVLERRIIIDKPTSRIFDESQKKSLRKVHFFKIKYY